MPTDVPAEFVAGRGTVAQSARGVRGERTGCRIECRQQARHCRVAGERDHLVSRERDHGRCAL